MVQAQVMGHDDRHPNPYQSHDGKELDQGMVKELEQGQVLEWEQVLEQELEQERVLELELGMDLGMELCIHLRNHVRDHQNHDHLYTYTSHSSSCPFTASWMEQLAS